MTLLFFVPKSITKNLQNFLTVRLEYWKKIITTKGMKRTKVHIYTVKAPLKEFLGSIITEYDDRSFPRFRYGADLLLEIFRLKREKNFSFQDITYELNAKYQWLNINKSTIKRLYDFTTDVLIKAILGSDPEYSLIKLVPRKLLLLIIPRGRHTDDSGIAESEIQIIKKQGEKEAILINNNENSYIYRLMSYIGRSTHPSYEL